jgi:hypothetical protein
MQHNTIQYNAHNSNTHYNTYVLIFGYFIFQRALQANGFAFELIKGLRHVFVVIVAVVTSHCVVVSTIVAAAVLSVSVDLVTTAGRRYRTSRHGPTMTEGSVKGRNVGVFFYFFFCFLLYLCPLASTLASFFLWIESRIRRGYAELS